ncbi:HAUS augmin-like complex subunit 1 [Engraulis encrasicolus]|uniref:HAUS augmin-like complex subunit 1 n=1 Tax=Engraulis encrasicolus TaxID=184585 RepID=UPI002FD59C9C
MCEKSKEVSEWLKVVLGEEQVPWFEVNKSTLDILHKLSKNSEQRCKETELLVEDFKQKTEEYKVEGVYHQDLLDFVLGERASSDLQEEPLGSCLKALVHIVEEFKLKDTNVGSLMSCVYNQTARLHEEDERNRRLQNKLSSLERRKADIHTSQKSLVKTISETQACQDVETVETDEKLLNMDFLDRKHQELTLRIKNAQDQLVSRDVSSSLTHHSIKEMSEQLTVLKQEMEPFKRKLQAFHGLPPSIPLARLAVAECKSELESLDAILDEKIDWRHT